MPQYAIQRALEGWREGERLLASLSPASPGYSAVECAVQALREAYRQLSVTPDLDGRRLNEVRAAIDNALAAIQEASADAA